MSKKFVNTFKRFVRRVNMKSDPGPNWQGLERHLTQMTNLPDCVPTNVREWNKFKEEYETGVVKQFKKSPTECWIDLKELLLVVFRSFGVDFVSYIPKNIKAMIRHDISTGDLDEIMIKIIQKYEKTSPIGILPARIALIEVLSMGRIDLTWHFIAGYGHKDSFEEFLKFLGVPEDSLLYEMRPVDYWFGLNYHIKTKHISLFIESINSSGKTAKDVMNWVIEYGDTHD